MFDGQVAAHEEGGCLVLSGELQRWSDVVLAGKYAIDKNPYYGLVNDIECTGETCAPIRKPRIEDSSLEWEEPDVLIIGGGIIGCAIARELSRYKLSVLLVEKEHDVAMQASGRNDGIVRAGIDLKKDTQRYKYCKQGNAMFDDICAQLGVDFDRTGQYFYFAKRMWEPFMPLSLIYWKWMGLKGTKVIKGDQLRKYEPTIDPGIRSALFFPTAGVVCPFDLTVAYAENAVQNGVTISFDTIVESMTTEDGRIKSVTTNRGTIIPKVVVNAAGVFSDDIAHMAGDRFFSIHPRKGTTAIIDKKHSDSLVQTSFSAIGAASKKRRHAKGGGVIRTIDGSTLVGPDNVETIQREDFSTISHNVKEVFNAHSRANPLLDEDHIISYFSGIRAATYEEDFIVGKGRYTSNIVHAAGIQAPGLTAAPAISVDIAQIVLDFFGGEKSVGVNPEFNPIRTAPPRLAQMDYEARAALIETNPDYGIIICRCEEISKGEILGALRRNVRCDTIDGVKRRVRAGMGRCQGSYCSPQVLDIIAGEKRLAPHNVKKSGTGSEVLFGNLKTLQQKKSSTGSASGDLLDFVADPDREKRMRQNAELMMAASMLKKKGDTDGNE